MSSGLLLLGVHHPLAAAGGGTPPTVHASAQNATPANPIVVTLTVSADDVLIAAGEADSAAGGTFSATGFDQLINQVTTTDGSTIGILRKKDSTGSDGSISISNTGGNQKIGLAISVTGADNTTPEDVASVVANNNTGMASPWTIDASITPVTNGCLIVAIMNSDSNSGDVAHSFATTSGTTGAWTVHQDVNSLFHNIAIATAEQTTAGAITVRGTGTLASGSAGRSLTLIALRPA